MLDASSCSTDVVNAAVDVCYLLTKMVSYLRSKWREPTACMTETIYLLIISSLHLIGALLTEQSRSSPHHGLSLSIYIQALSTWTDFMLATSYINLVYSDCYSNKYVTSMCAIRSIML